MKLDFIRVRSRAFAAGFFAQRPSQQIGVPLPIPTPARKTAHRGPRFAARGFGNQVCHSTGLPSPIIASRTSFTGGKPCFRNSVWNCSSENLSPIFFL